MFQIDIFSKNAFYFRSFFNNWRFSSIESWYCDWQGIFCFRYKICLILLRWWVKNLFYLAWVLRHFSKSKWNMMQDTLLSNLLIFLLTKTKWTFKTCIHLLGFLFFQKLIQWFHNKFALIKDFRSFIIWFIFCLIFIIFCCITVFWKLVL